jgi:hypothetical protein
MALAGLLIVIAAHLCRIVWYRARASCGHGKHLLYRRGGHAQPLRNGADALAPGPAGADRIDGCGGQLPRLALGLNPACDASRVLAVPKRMAAATSSITRIFSLRSTSLQRSAM